MPRSVFRFSTTHTASTPKWWWFATRALLVLSILTPALHLFFSRASDIQHSKLLAALFGVNYQWSLAFYELFSLYATLGLAMLSLVLLIVGLLLRYPLLFCAIAFAASLLPLAG
jgi:uncharacterized membrane protein YhaH (DUF805 family)